VTVHIYPALRANRPLITTCSYSLLPRRGSEIRTDRAGGPVGRGAPERFSTPSNRFAYPGYPRLSREEDALLPNAVIIAFIDGVSVQDLGNGRLEVRVDVSGGPPGFVVDGQQRLRPSPA
jgi:hypothetical protein